MRKLVVTAVGGVLLAAGVLMIVFPGPALLFIPAALAVLSTEYRWAHRAMGVFRKGLDWARRKRTERDRTTHTGRWEVVVHRGFGMPPTLPTPKDRSGRRRRRPRRTPEPA